MKKSLFFNFQKLVLLSVIAQIQENNSTGYLNNHWDYKEVLR